MRRIELETATELIIDSIQPITETEKIEISQALGRVLAEDLSSPIDIPGYDRSPYDGFAIRTEDLEGEGIKEFQVIEEIHAGYCPTQALKAGQAIRIMTGSMMPEFADNVVKFEDTIQGESSFTTQISLTPYQNFVNRGEDLKKGQEILRSGERLSAIHIGLLAGMGIREVLVYRPIIVGVLSTGDEVIDYDSGPLPPGKIYDSNQMTILHRLKELGITELRKARSIDKLSSLKAQMAELIESCDFLITIGGVSVGDYDLVPKALEELGADEVFWKLKLKPGSPIHHSMLKGKPVLSLSGNPFAALSTFEIFGREILAKLLNTDKLLLRPGKGIAGTAFAKKSNIRRFLRGRLEESTVYLPEKHHAGVLSSMLNCNVLVDIPEGTQSIQVGDELTFWYL
ncbi:MAG: molybdopterin molybdotransferase MoeA [Tissierellia bacterium]|nr:molybdopterin molybdotransferase MoeA [Tissierellia bacterium]